MESALQRLLDNIVPALKPEAVYLFGSRARGDHATNSDYDLLVVVADETPREVMNLSATAKLSKGTGLCADIVACRRGWFEAKKGRVGALPYKATHEGRIIHGA